MTNNLVKRLRDSATTLNRPGGVLNPADWLDSADALERLRVALGEVIRVYDKAYGNHGWELDDAINDARKALEAGR